MDLPKRFRSTALRKLRSGLLSDFRIQCGDLVFNVHKAILAAKYDFYFKL
jgi:hypothetical protein